MEKTFTMPKMGMTMTEGTVLRWLYQEGEQVQKGEPLVEVMTDKVNMEVEAPFNGVLTNIVAQEGDILPVGAPLATLVDDMGSTVATTPATTISQVRIVPSTPAAKREAALHGITLQSVLQAGAVAPLDRTDILNFVQQAQAKQPEQTGQTQQNGNGTQKVVRATPVAQKIAQEHQLDLALIAEGKAGEKVTRADVEAHLSRQTQPTKVEQSTPTALTSQATTQETPAKMSVQKQQDESELVPFSPIRRLIGQRMQRSIVSAPHIYLDLEVDMTEAEHCRQRIGQSLQAQGEPSPSLTAIIVRAVAAALIQHPQANAAVEPWDSEKGEPGKQQIRQWHAVHIGIAVDTERALLTPVIRNAHQQTVPTLARELRRLAQAARQNTLKPEEMANATFTISNLGMYGIETFHAIIAPGQSAILAVGKVTKRSVVIEDKQGERLEIRPIMKLSLSADHRVLDGASGSRFLHSVKTLLEDPYLLL